MRAIKYIRHILPACMLLAGVACSNDMDDFPSPSEADNHLTLRIVPEDAQVVETRAITPNENLMYNMTVVVFSPAGTLFSITYADVGSGAGVAMRDINTVISGLEAGYSIYVFANVGNNSAGTTYYRNYFNDIGLQSDVTGLARVINTPSDAHVLIRGNNPSNYLYAMPMIGFFPTESDTSGIVPIPLKRISAKVNYTVRVNGATAPSDMKIKCLRFGGVPMATYFVPHSADFYLHDNEYLVSDWIDPATGGLSATGTMYLYENRKKTGPDKNERSGVVPSPANATYMEVVLSSGGKEYYCKAYLGTDYATNYDVLRNCIYNLTVNVNGVDNMETDMRRVRVITDQWYNTDGLLLHYDGISNNGRDNQRVNNATTKSIADPALVSWGGTNKGLPPFTPPDYSDDAGLGAKNRWKNIAPGTEGNFNLALYRFTYPAGDEPANGWGPDCLILNGSAIATLEYDDPRLYPQQFTIEVVFRSDPGQNTNSNGCDIYGFLNNPNAQPYVTAGLEAYDTGFGFIAGTQWNGQNYMASRTTGVKRSVVLTFDGMYVRAYYCNKLVYQERKYKIGPITWATAKVGSDCKTFETTSSELTLGRYWRANADAQYSGRIYSFRFYDRVLTQQEMTDNFQMDVFRFGVIPD